MRSGFRETRICFMHALDGSTAPYVHLVQSLDGFTSYGLYAPGLVDARPITDCMPDLLKLDNARQGRWVLVGWSFGAWALSALAEDLACAGLTIGRCFFLEPPAIEGPAPKGLTLAMIEAAYAELFRHLSSRNWERGPWQMDDETKRLLIRCDAPAMLQLRLNPPRIRRMMRVRLGLIRGAWAHKPSPVACPTSLVLGSRHESKRAGWEGVLGEHNRTLVVDGGHGSVVWPGPSATQVAHHISAMSLS
jgi:thioesterase domain-containing protein